MTQDKELLLKDLCARLPYGVKVLVDNKHWCDFDGCTPSKITFDNSYRLLFLGTKLGYVKPYLFPISSMTDEQKDEYHNTCNVGLSRWGDESYYATDESIDWLNAHHYDYRRLIEKGLAIDATDKNVY